MSRFEASSYKTKDISIASITELSNVYVRGVCKYCIDAKRGRACIVGLKENTIRKICFHVPVYYRLN